MSTLRRSMTGYGAGTTETPDYRVVVEIKAVNQRFLEIVPHMPRAFGAWENDLRDVIRSRVARGKLDVYVNFEDHSEKRYEVHVNENLARAYYAALGKVARAVDAPLNGSGIRGRDLGQRGYGHLGGARGLFGCRGTGTRGA